MNLMSLFLAIEEERKGVVQRRGKIKSSER